MCVCVQTGEDEVCIHGHTGQDEVVCVQTGEDEVCVQTGEDEVYVCVCANRRG